MEATLPVPPFWFKQRQCQLEPTDQENVLKVIGPNLPDAFIGVRKNEAGLWQAVYKPLLDGEEEITTPFEFSTSHFAWTAAFELYRTRVVY